jgi:uncharacterized protein YfaT (DUF1175 family)
MHEGPPEDVEQAREAEEEVDGTGTPRLRMQQDCILFVSCAGSYALQHHTSRSTRSQPLCESVIWRLLVFDKKRAKLFSFQLFPP